MNLRPFRLWILLGAALALTAGRALSAAPFFDTPSVVGGRITLRLHGDAGQTYRIEVSTNLSTWTELLSAPAAAGLLTAQHSPPPGTAATFYRGVSVSLGSPYPAVQASLATNLTATTLALPDVASVLRLETPHQILYSLVLPTNAVDSPQPVRMTVLSAVNGVPAQNGFLAGVQIEPAGLPLNAPTFLQIDFPSAIPAAQVSSYAFDGDGRRLHLVPDIVITNRVRIPITQWRSYACGVFTLDELNALAATVPPARTTSARAGLQASIEECYPDDEAEARRMTAELEDRVRPLQQQAARELGIERQKQLLGAADENAASEALTRVLVELDPFYRNEIQSRIPEAVAKCAKARALMPWALGYERQRQLLGLAADDEAADPAISELLCAGSKRCQEQAIDCCRTQGGDTRLISFLLGIERQRQLLGLGESCGSALDVPGVIDQCAPRWIGRLTLTAGGAASTNLSSSAATINRVHEAYGFSLVADVAAVEEFNLPPILFYPAQTNLTFKMIGTLQGHHFRNQEYRDLWDGCSSGSPRVLAGRARPQDGGYSRWQSTLQQSSTTNRLEFDLHATLLAPGASAPGLDTSLSFHHLGFTVPFEGTTEGEERATTSRGCDITDLGALVLGQDHFGSFFVNVKADAFQYTGDSIHYETDRPVTIGYVKTTQRLVLDLRRLKR